ncbi:uncharacterized protein LOC124542331 [Vanessa cardui]|uniref:uncharacterized protein LOC124542331 n=1 Tax=Vanessa cardui TaxID=171605 RepID=UPI001F147993|nr:uncharacterized protein LOC124542331 [Vanessa cardui]
MEYMIVVLLLVLLTQETSFKITTTTLKPKERIHVLRQKLNEEILNKRAIDLYPDNAEGAFLEDYEYVQIDKTLPITPVMDFDPKKLNDKFKLRPIKNKKKQSKTSPVKDDNVKMSAKKATVTEKALRLYTNRSKIHLRKKKRVRTKKPLEIFYRRVYNTDMLHERIEWIHCQDMITPILTGMRVNISNPKRLFSKDPIVLRFIQLLNVNTSTYSRDDIYSILYQISNLQLRLFQWDIVPLNILLNVIIKERKHTFGNLKHGIRDLFNNWRLDISNTSSLLRQARIFRPPCVKVSTSDGSTKSPKVTKYKKNGKETTRCDDDDDCED